MHLYIIFIFLSFLMGFAVTLLYKDELFFEERIFYGTLIGFFTSTWIGYIEALFFGLDLNTIIFTSAVLLILTLIILLINFSLVSKRIVPPFRNLLNTEVISQIVIVSLILFPVFYVLFGRVIIWKEDGIYTGLIYNFGDLPYHWSMINSFIYGENLPPERTDQSLPDDLKEKIAEILSVPDSQWNSGTTLWKRCAGSTYRTRRRSARGSSPQRRRNGG